MNNILEEIKDAKSIAISGHIRPDGDCIGSVTAVYNYIKENTSGIDIDAYAERIPENFMYLKNIDEIIVGFPDTDKEYDLMICLDSSDLARIGDAVKYFNKSKKTICIDHHISNDSYAQVCHVLPDASSTCEVLYGLMDNDKISKHVAESLYTGLIHDTGVFKHSNTSKYTLEVAGALIDKGVGFSKIIDESFYMKSFKQNKLLGEALLKADMKLDGKVIYTYVSLKTMSEYEALASDLDGIVDQLRITEGVEVAILAHETSEGDYKISMRSNNDVNVSDIAVSYGGGGHIKAAGCNIKGDIHQIVDNLVEKIAEQL